MHDDLSQLRHKNLVYKLESISVRHYFVSCIMSMHQLLKPGQAVSKSAFG